MQSRIAMMLWIGALAGGISYMFLPLTAVDGTMAIVWKGAGVTLLALWCAGQARTLDGWLIAVVMAFGALGDVLLEAVGLNAGAVAFVAGHVIAMLLYIRNWRPRLTPSQFSLAALTVPLSVAIAASLVAPVERLPIGIYTVFVAGMAAAAWASRFPRYRTGIGAMMFLVSDLLIFARMGPLGGSIIPDLLVWPLYFGGQVLIAVGVVTTLATDERT